MADRGPDGVEAQTAPGGAEPRAVPGGDDPAAEAQAAPGRAKREAETERVPGGGEPNAEPQPLPGGADPGAVRRALDTLAPLGDQVTPGGALGRLTTYRVGGGAAVLVTAERSTDLDLVRDSARSSGLPVLVVGRGSNLLVADAGFGGIALVLDPEGFGAVIIDGVGVRAGAAVALPALARQTVDAGLTGLEWAVGVPGSVGGGVRMNAGGHGSDIAHSLHSCRVQDLSPDGPGGSRTLLRPDLQYGYRTSAIQATDVVVEARFQLAPGNRQAGRETIRDIVRWRREHQPGGQNAGSVFTNPPGEPPADSAGWLIETAGCKGQRWGTAMVSPKHANFIQADDQGSADDVRALLEAVRSEVARVHRVDLETEVRMIGFTSQPSTSGRGL
jgi:UDP-N-acetylmuramate dehydrogenase